MTSGWHVLGAHLVEEGLALRAFHVLGAAGDILLTLGTFVDK